MMFKCCIFCIFVSKYFSDEYARLETTTTKRFSNVQLALLELFTEDVPEEDLLEIKKILSAYRFKLATEAADQVAREKGWGAKDFDRLLHKHVRKPYKKSSSDPAE